MEDVGGKSAFGVCSFAFVDLCLLRSPELNLELVAQGI